MTLTRHAQPALAAPRIPPDRAAWVPLGLALGYLALRLPLLPGFLQNHDAVNFALALDHFDLQRQQPHFPGYPVYLALAWPFRALGAPLALTLPGVIAGATACAALYQHLQRHGALVAATAAGLYLTLPGIWIQDLTATSDALGLHLTTLALCAVLSRRSPHLTALALGLLVGVRLSLLPLALGALAPLATCRRRPASIVGGFVAGGLLWVLPLILLAGGPEALLQVALDFTHGHATGWGGTAADAGPLQRSLALGLALAKLLGPVGLGLLGLGLLLPAAPKRTHRAALLWIGLPYLAWIWVGQNLQHPRHALPLIPIALLAWPPDLARLTRTGAARVHRLWALTQRHPASRPAGGQPSPRPGHRAPLIAAPIVALSLGLSLPQAIAHTASLPPTLQALQYITHRFGAEGLQIYTGGEARLFRRYAPGFRARRVTSGAQILKALATSGRARRVLVTSAAGDLGALGSALRPLAEFRRGTEQLTLFQLDAPRRRP